MPVQLEALPLPIAGSAALVTDPPESFDDDRILAALRAGSRVAADSLVKETYPRIFSYVLRLTGGDRERAADLTQETYRKAWQGLAGFDGRSRLATWITRIAYTTFLDDARRPRLFTPLSDDPRHDPRDPEPPAEERLERQQVETRLRHAVMNLPEELRFAVTARFWANLSVEEIGRLSGVTGVGVRKRLKRAFRSIAVHLEGTEP